MPDCMGGPEVYGAIRNMFDVLLTSTSKPPRMTTASPLSLPQTMSESEKKAGLWPVFSGGAGAAEPDPAPGSRTQLPRAGRPSKPAPRRLAASPAAGLARGWPAARACAAAPALFHEGRVATPLPRYSQHLLLSADSGQPLAGLCKRQPKASQGLLDPVGQVGLWCACTGRCKQDAAGLRHRLALGHRVQ